MRLLRPVVLTFAAAVLGSCSGPPSSVPGTGGTTATQTVTLGVLGFEPGDTSATIELAPVAGARDYRIYAANDPTRVRYAGSVDDGHGGVSPSTRITWSGLQPGGSVTLVAEAVDALGPYPVGNLASFDPPLPGACVGAWRPPATAPLAPLRQPPDESVAVPGSDAGAVPDGIALGGEGCPSDRPQVIARSAPFIVRASAAAPIPSSPSASSTFFDAFGASEAGTLEPIVAADPNAGTATLTFGTRPTSWTILEDGADVVDSRVFVLDGHLSDVLYDGTSSAPHAGRASIALVPNADADLSAGRIVHATMQVDARADAHRSVGIAFAPAGDPLLDVAGTGGPVDRSGYALFIKITGTGDGAVAADEYVPGPGGGSELDLHLAGAPGKAPHDLARSGAARAASERSRFDVFLSATHLAMFENGTELGEFDLPRALPFARAKLYFTHFLTRSATALAEARAAGSTAAWTALSPFSDQREWSDLGFESLPAGSAWSALGAATRLPNRLDVAAAF